MVPIRIDENSLDKSLKEVFELPEGSIFCVSPEYFEKFIELIPDDKYFKFSKINEGTPEYVRYGSDSYKVLKNKKTYCF